MRQKVVLIYSVAALLGCSGPVEYEHRIEQSVNDLKDLQKYDTYLAPSVGGGLQDFGVQLRPPKPLAIDPNSALQVPAEVVDISESYSGVGAGVPVVLHVLATRKNPRAPAEGEPAPPRPQRLAILLGHRHRHEYSLRSRRREPGHGDGTRQDLHPPKTRDQ